MENGDSNAEMADYGTDFSDDVDPNATRDSGIGSPVSPFFGGDSESGFPIPDWPGLGIGKRPGAVSRFGRDRELRSRSRESGSRGRHAGDFLVWFRRWDLGKVPCSQAEEPRASQGGPCP